MDEYTSHIFSEDRGQEQRRAGEKKAGPRADSALARLKLAVDFE
jgi:hypothetical protein